MPHIQKPLTRKPEPGNPGKFIAEEVHVYNGPMGEGEVTLTYRINASDKVQVKIDHVGPEPRNYPAGFNDVDEAPKLTPEKKTRIVTKTVLQRDAQNKPHEVVKPDFEEVYYEDVLVANPSPARKVIEGKP